MTLRRGTSCARLGVLLMLAMITARSAAAQVSFGSPGDPPRVALGGGAFDLLPDTKKEHAATVGLMESEYRFGDVWWILSPFIGVMGTGQGAFYGYFGFGFDINFPYSLVLTPSAAAGYFHHGQGIDLGSWWEFRTGGELDYRFADQRRIGIGFYHMSNAGIGRENPGQEMANLVFTMPLQ